MTTHKVGDKVRIAQDVKRYGGKPGFVVMVNEIGGPLVEPAPPNMPLGDRDSLPRHPEYGIILTTHQPPWRKDGSGQMNYDSDMVKWFNPNEVVSR